MKRALAIAALLVAGACSSPPERVVQKVDGSVAFRLGAKPEGVEIRVESGFYRTSGYELLAHVEGSAPTLSSGITVVLDGVRVPLEAKGDGAPATALLYVPLSESLEDVTWSFIVKLPVSEGAFRKDAYTVRHTAAGWRLVSTTGSFSRFEAQGSY
jgi:hypothetical protein